MFLALSDLLVFSVVKNLQSPGPAKDLIIALGKLPVSLETLTKTRIGMTVNNLRKAVKDLDEETSTMAKELIKKWKKLIDKDKDKDKDSSSTSSVNGNVSSPSNSSKANGNSKDKSEKDSNSSSSASSSKITVNNTFKKPATASTATNSSSRAASVPSSDPSVNEIRSKCREMIANALRLPLPENMIQDDMDIGEFGDPNQLAEEIESCIFKEFKNTEFKYKNRVRSRVSNLRDNRNPDLRLNVLRGIISTERIAKMEATEMASAEMKQLRDKITQEMIQEHQMSLTGGTQTDLIKCPKCRKTNVTYNQVQTRSADEPMTTFCLCNECGKRWKFC